MGVLQFDSVGRCLYSNQKWSEIAGVTQGQTLGLGWMERLHPDDLSFVLVKWSNATRLVTDFEMEFRVLRPSGESRFLKARACEIDSLNGAKKRRVHFLEDITELRLSQDERSEYTRILESSLNEIYVFDAETLHFEFVNDSASRNLGYSAEELRRMTPVDIKPLFHLATFEESLKPLRNRETDLLQFKTIHRRADGTDYHVDVHLQMSVKANKPVFLAIILDISERITLESENAIQTELHRAIVDNAVFAIITTSPNGTITSVNPAAERLLGYSAGELIDKCTPRTFHLDREIAARAREFGAELGIHLVPGFSVFVEKSHRNLPNEHEWTYVRKDGSYVPVLLGITVLRDESKVVTGYLGIAIDISQRRQAEDALKASEKRLELAVRGSSDGLWDWNLLSADVHFSPRFHELLGLTKNDPVIDRQDVFIGLIHPEDRTPYKKAVDAHLENGKPFDTVTRVRTKQGEWRWFRIRGEAAKERDGVPARMAGTISDITPQKTAEEKLARAAVTDQLTGLSNRAHFLERMNGAIARATSFKSLFTVMFLDFDRFKAINDSWGHDVGDTLLRQIADRLREGIFASKSSNAQLKTVARLGGDEFVVLVEKLDHPNDAITIVENLQSILSKPYQLGKHQARSSASIGIVVGPSHYDRAEDILQDADAAMYEAKQAGRARYVLFDTDMRNKARRRYQIELDLSDAIGTPQLTLHYQPVVSLLTGEVSFVEATVQWQNPTLGSIDPSEFLAIAQESSLILDLNEWILLESCRQCGLWCATLGPAAPPQVSVNLPHQQFADPGLVDLLRRILADTGLPPNRLLLEISQDCFRSDTAEAIETMKAIRDLGVELAIDEFGLGTASFINLHLFPVSMLKLDRSLIKQIDNSKCEAALLHGLVVMARNLNVKLVAEGIELRCQHKAIQELGCEFMQGPFFANPMPAPELENFLADNRCDRGLAVGAMAFAGGWSERMTYIEPASPMPS